MKASRTDPDASLVRRSKGGSHLSYHTHYVVDGGKALVILQALVTPSEVMENQPIQLLRFANHLHTYRAARYQADAATCNACPAKSRCTTSSRGRTLRRSLDESYFDRVRGYQGTEPYEKALRKRRVWVEPVFAEGKGWHGMSRFRLRRLRKVNEEALLVAAWQNAKRLLEFGGRGRWFRRPPCASRRGCPYSRSTGMAWFSDRFLNRLGCSITSFSIRSGSPTEPSVEPRGRP